MNKLKTFIWETFFQEKQATIDFLNKLVHDHEEDLKEGFDLLQQERFKVATLKKEKQKLLDLISDSIAKKPEWLNTRLTPYMPKINLVWDNQVVKTFPLEPKEFYTVTPSLKEAAFNILAGVSGFDKRVKTIWDYVCRHINYTHDHGEDWRFPQVTNVTLAGDCFAGYEEIYTKNGITKIKDVKEGDLVLSYDFKKNEFVYKPIIAKWDKGMLQINRVHFRNGTHIDVSKNHPFWVRYTQKGSKYKKQYLSEIDLTKWHTRKVPIAKHLPREIIDKPEITKEVAEIIGYFLAEGSIGKDKRVSMSGAYLDTNILKLIDALNIPYRKRKNNSNVTEIILHKSWLSDLLRTFTTGKDTLSFSAKIPEWVFHLNNEKLDALIKGYYLGDGTKNVGKNQGNKEYILSTSSYELAMDLQRIALYLGFSFHVWKQDKHGGVGTKPIYRLTKNPMSHFLKDFGFKDISEVSISKVEKLEETQMYDVTVADTHTVVMRNGIITHQCEDSTILFVTLCRIAGVPADRVFNATGWYKPPYGLRIGHSFPIVKLDDGKWYIFESTLHRAGKPKLFKGSIYDASWGVSNWQYQGKLDTSNSLVTNNQI